jgi:hypothetical protein
MLFTYCLLLCVAVFRVEAQMNQLQNYCKRYGDQTAVVDKALYLQGGLVNYVGSSNNFSSKLILSLLLTN